MHILYIIGNGFDISQNMRTSYRDFEEEYRKIQSKDSEVQRFKDTINPQNNLWVDLELAFGKYTKEIHSIADFEHIYDDLIIGVERYIRQQDDAYHPDETMVHTFRGQAIMPERFLEPADEELLRDYIDQYIDARNQEIIIDAINFNYTTAFERALAYGDNVTNQFPNRIARCGKVCHVHGTLTQPPLMLGVDSPEQIANESLRTDVDTVQNTMVKPISNQATRMNRDRQAERLINSANLIVCFGTSLGATDQTWWHKIAQRVENNGVPLIIHHYSGIQHDVRKKARWLLPAINDVKNHFYQSISTEVTDLNMAHARKVIDNRIFVALDKPLFQPESK